MSVRVVRAEPQHKQAWDDLYRAYAEFYRVEQTPAMRDRVWGWIHDPAHQVECFLAVDDAGTPVGLAHFRAFARPLAATTGGFLDDLYVTPAARGRAGRGSGAAEALLAALADEARLRGWSVVRWITADDNYRARSFYDRIARRTPWVTYDMQPAGAAPAD